MMVVRLEDHATIGTIDITDFSPMHARGEVGFGSVGSMGSGISGPAVSLAVTFSLAEY